MRHLMQRLVGLTLAFAAALAQAQQPAQPAAAAQQGPPAVGLAQLLASAPVRQQLGFTDEQTEKLKQAFQNYQQQQPARPDIEGLAEQQQRQAVEQYQQQLIQQAEKLGQAMAEILTEEQKEQLRQISFRITAFNLLADPRVIQELGLSEEQQKKLIQIREEMQNQMWQLQEQSAKQSLEVLRAEDLTKLRNFLERNVRQQAPANGPQQARPSQPPR